MPKLHSNQSASYREINERNLYLKTVKLKPLPWWKVCARVDPEQLREEYKLEVFNILRAKGLTNDERERIRALVSDEQKRRLRRATRIEQGKGHGL